MSVFAQRLLTARPLDGLSQVVTNLGGDLGDLRAVKNEVGGNISREFNRQFARMAALSQKQFLVLLEQYVDGDNVTARLKDMCARHKLPWAVIVAVTEAL